MTEEELRQLIISSRAEATAHMDNIRNAEQLTYELLDRELVAYIMCKFHLADEDMTTDNFSDLARISLTKSMNISPELVKEFDIARSCDGVSSHMAKMFLLYMAIQKELKVSLPPKETAYVESVHDISLMVWKAMGHSA